MVRTMAGSKIGRRRARFCCSSMTPPKSVFQHRRQPDSDISETPKYRSRCQNVRET
jgi:hypothetical protein